MTHTWFDQMYAPVAARGIAFTAVGVVTSDPASVESVLTWADRLQRRVAYVIVENETDTNAPFTYWRASAQALAFQQTFTPHTGGDSDGLPLAAFGNGHAQLRGHVDAGGRPTHDGAGVAAVESRPARDDVSHAVV